jgi:outer membrane receptor protein involved in Fe transport
MILNGLAAKSYGAELLLTWQATDWWQLRGGYTFLKNAFQSPVMRIKAARRETIHTTSS